MLQHSAEARAVLRRVDAEPYRDAVRDAILAEDWPKLVDLTGQKAALEQPPGFTAFLGETRVIPVERRRHLLAAASSRRPGNLGLLMTLGGSYLRQKEWADERLRWYQAAVAASPTNFAAHNNLGAILCDLKRDYDGAIACYKKAIELDPKLALAHFNLGQALHGKGQMEEAIACWRKAIELDPKDAAKAHINLGTALARKGKVEEAIACFKKAIALHPKDAKAHTNLGVALKDKGKVEEAIACFHKAIALDPNYAPAHNGLGTILSAIKQDYDGAIVCFRKAIALAPKDALTHTNLGGALAGKGQVDEGIACVKKAIELDPKLALAHFNLGLALAGKGKDDEAIACYHKAIECDPKYALPHYSLGNALVRKGQVGKAIACFQKAIALDPRYAEAHCNLGRALRRQGRFAESLAAYKRGHELGRKQPGWRFPSAAWVRQAERLAALEAKLPAFLEGEFQPTDTAERLGLAGVCQAKKRHHAATRLYAAAFAAEPRLAANLQAGVRYNAACCAALAAAGVAEDAARLSAAQRLALRRRTLTWLHADLRTWQVVLAREPAKAQPAVTKAMQHWLADPDFSGVRGPEALGRLPTEERAAWEKLWAGVADTLARAQQKPQAARKADRQ
jgi:tetratricopeptide (TPR) repeat protein